MLRGLFHSTAQGLDLANSALFDQTTFYRKFVSDLRQAQSEVVIESPFLTTRRITDLMPAFRQLHSCNVTITVNTRHPDEHDEYLGLEADQSIAMLQGIGVRVLFTGGHHRKLAILDRRVLYEGSLNILSQNDSCEIMRRIESEAAAKQMIEFVQLGKFLDHSI